MLIPLGVLVVIAIYVFSTYNAFVQMRTRIRASVQEIANQLKRQANLIPNLEESAKAYLKHEKKIFKRLTDARKSVAEAVKSGKLADADKASAAIGKLLPDLRVIVESNPEIKGADVIQKLMNELRDTADKLMYARRTLIDLVADFNAKVLQVPTNFVAKLFGFKQEVGLKVEGGEEGITKVSKEETKERKVDLGS
jgi:LemA protein